MQTYTAVIHIQLHNNPVTLTVDGKPYEPATQNVIDALTLAIDRLRNDPTIVSVVTCRVILGDRRRPPRAAEHVPLVDLMLIGQTGRAPARLQETVALLPETKHAAEEAAKLIFLEHLNIRLGTTSAPQSSNAPPELVPTH